MKKAAAIALSVFMLPFMANAQSGVMEVHPASGNNGKILTMEETILGRNIRPEYVYCGWTKNGLLTVRNRDSLSVMYPETGKTEKWEKEKPDADKYVPENAENRTASAIGNIAFTIGKSLYYTDKNGNTYTIAGSKNNQVTYGQLVSRNEFGIDGGIFWSPDGKKIAFYRKDESKVTDFPLLNINSRTGNLFTIKYPMNGMGSENVRLGIYDLAANTVVYAAADDFGYDQYLTNISWSPDGRFIFIQVLDRTQKHLHLNMYSSSDGRFVKTILTENNDKYVEPLDKLHFLKGTYTFIYRTDNRDGYRNLYLCDTLCNVRRLTGTDADVEYVSNDGKAVYYTSAEVSPVENHLFRVIVKNNKSGKLNKAKFGKPERLTSEKGWHSITMSPDCKWYADTYSSINTPGVTFLKSSDGKITRRISVSSDPLKNYETGEVDLGTVKSADGKYDNYYRLIKPVNFDPTKKYPLILYVYGGPHSQLVRNSWLASIRMWEMYMAERGYLVYVQDNRGTQNRGADYEKAIHDYCGQAEMADQMEGIKMLESLPFVDSSRIGVHGWSYGGFMTISLITNHPGVFKVAVAGGPVIDWKWYEVMYGERYMDTMAVNPDGFAETSLINKAKDLKGKLLICQGAVDNTVLWENSLSFIRECIKDNIKVDYFPYPCAQHNVRGKDRIHLMNKVSDYFAEYL